MKRKLGNASEFGGRYMGLNELQAYAAIGQSTARKLGESAGAAVKIGRRVLYDRKKIDAYIGSLSQKGEQR